MAGGEGANAHSDEFEARHMHDGAPVVHRDKRVSRGMAALLATPGLFVVAFAAVVAVINGTSPKPLPAGALPFVVAALAALGLLFVALGLVFAVLRTLVTTQAVHVKYGMWGPRIPLADIESCAIVDYDWTEFGGWGIRLGKGGDWAYVPASGRVLEIRYRDGAARKRVLVGVSDPDEVMRQIERARQRVRVAPDSAESAAGERRDAVEVVEPEVAGRARTGR